MCNSFIEFLLQSASVRLVRNSHSMHGKQLKAGERVFVMINAANRDPRAFEDPEMWGMLLVDIARHAARAYGRESEFSEEEALSRILDMFEAEIERPTDMGSTTPRSQQGH